MLFTYPTYRVEAVIPTEHDEFCVVALRVSDNDIEAMVRILRMTGVKEYSVAYEYPLEAE